jgi:hypothetical protein
MVQIFAGRKIFVIAKMIGPKRFGNSVFLAEPFAEIDQFAALGTERPKSRFKPCPFLLTSRTFDRALRVHKTKIAQKLLAWSSEEVLEEAINLLIRFWCGIVSRTETHRDPICCPEQLINFVHAIQRRPALGLIFRAT